MDFPWIRFNATQEDLMAEVMKRTERISVAIIGCAGVPGNYGGFETLAENLVYYHRDHASHVDLTVYCSSTNKTTKPPNFVTAKLRFIPLNANGRQAMFYDMWSLIDAALRSTDVVLLLGHGGSFIVPVLRLLTPTKFITNIDGIEWRREKWSGLARAIIRKSEAFAVRHSHTVIADNKAIGKYITEKFHRSSEFIPYGGDHALEADPDPTFTEKLPESFALSLCRIEPENNVAMILEAFDRLDTPLVFVGNWDNSEYGRQLKANYRDHLRITILDPVYSPRKLRALRNQASLYVHGHSAGGTNPALVEMMHFGIPIVAHGCSFNRFTTEGHALYFESSQELAALVRSILRSGGSKVGERMLEIARHRYTWEKVGKAYFECFQR